MNRVTCLWRHGNDIQSLINKVERIRCPCVVLFAVLEVLTQKEHWIWASAVSWSELPEHRLRNYHPTYLDNRRLASNINLMGDNKTHAQRSQFCDPAWYCEECYSVLRITICLCLILTFLLNFKDSHQAFKILVRLPVLDKFWDHVTCFLQADLNSARYALDLESQKGQAFMHERSQSMAVAQQTLQVMHALAAQMSHNAESAVSKIHQGNLAISGALLSDCNCPLGTFTTYFSF